MTAREARQIIADTEPARQRAAAKRRSEYQKAQKDAAVKLREEIGNEAGRILKRTYDEIRRLAQDGQSRYSVRVGYGHMSQVTEGAVNNVIRHLKTEGYEACVDTDAVGTGVDEWRDDYYLSVSWGKI